MVSKIAQLIALALALSLWVDVFTYSGYLQSLISLSSKILLGLSIFFSTISFLLPPKTHQSPRLLTLLSLGVVLLYLVLITIEGITSQGYVYSLIRVRPESMFYPTLALTIFTLSTALRAKTISSSRIFSYLFLLSVLYFLLRQLPIVLVQSGVLLRTISTAPTASYDDKMRSHWGDFYDYMVYLKHELPAEGTVLGIPPQTNPWLLYGNGYLVQSFVYPTRIRNIDFDTEDIELPPYLMQLPDWPPDNPAIEPDRWGLIKL